MGYEQRILRSKTSAVSSPRTRKMDIFTISKDDNLQAVLQKITSPDNKERGVAVTDKGKVTALITEKDILEFMSKKKNVDIVTTKVEDVANTNFFSVREDETVQAAIQKMNDKQVDRVLVLTSKNEYFGWIKRDDIMRNLREMLR